MYKHLLTESDFLILKEKFSMMSNKEFCEYFNWYINDCRKNLLCTLQTTTPSSPLLKRYEKPFNISLASVKKFSASLGWYKKRLYISQINSKKAKKLQMQLMRLRAIDVTSPTEWFRNIAPGERSLGRFEDSGKCKSVSVLLHRWNKKEGREKGIFIYAKYYPEVSVVELTANNTTNQNNKEVQQ